MPTPPTILKDFTNGQGVGSADYIDYTEDQDSNWSGQDSYNLLVSTELNALQGGGAFINYDLVQVDDPTAPGGLRTVGVIGGHSYRVAINGDTTKLDVTAGTAIIQGNSRVRNSGPALLTTPGGAAAEHFVAIDVNGNPSIEILPGLRALDVANATWDGAAYTAVTAFENQGTELTDDLLATIMFDGDAHIRMLSRPTVGNFVQKIFLNPDARLNALERKLQNISTDSEGNAIGDLQLDADEISLGTLATARGGTNRSDASVADSSMLVGDASSTYALESGNTLRTSIGVGTADTPQFARLGLGAAASGSAEILITGTSTLSMTAGGAFMFVTEDARDIEFLRGASMRIDMNTNGVSLHDSAGNAMFDISAADTALIGRTGASLGFFGASAIARPDVSGSRGGNAALADLLTELASLGLIVDSSSA